MLTSNAVFAVAFRFAFPPVNPGKMEREWRLVLNSVIFYINKYNFYCFAGIQGDKRGNGSIGEWLSCYTPECSGEKD